MMGGGEEGKACRGKRARAVLMSMSNTQFVHSNTQLVHSNTQLVHSNTLPVHPNTPSRMPRSVWSATNG